jgi:Na+/proline symporter
MLGGVQAVTCTDVKQMVLILAGLSVVVIIIFNQLPSEVGLSSALKIAGSADRLSTVDFSFDLNKTYTFWSGLLGGLFLMLSYFGCDQSQVQRYLTARSVSEGRVSLLMSAFLKIPMQFGILLIGVLVFVFFHFEAPPLLFNPVAEEEMQSRQEYMDLNSEYQAALEDLRTASLGIASSPSAEDLEAYRDALDRREAFRSEAVQLVRRVKNDAAFTDVNYVFPSFVINHLPVGVVGLMIAAIFAAAMSSIAAELNSLATASVMDFYKRHVRPEATDRHYLKFSRLATAVWGLMACGVAVYATQLGSLIEVVNRFGSFFYGSLLGVFVLALGTKWATGRSAFWGLLAGIACVAVVSMTTEISFLWHNVVGVVAVVSVAAVISFIFPGPPARGVARESVE